MQSQLILQQSTHEFALARVCELKLHDIVSVHLHQHLRAITVIFQYEEFVCLLPTQPPPSTNIISM